MGYLSIAYFLLLCFLFPHNVCLCLILFITKSPPSSIFCQTNTSSCRYLAGDLETHHPRIGSFVQHRGSRYWRRKPKRYSKNSSGPPNITLPIHIHFLYLLLTTHLPKPEVQECQGAISRLNHCTAYGGKRLLSLALCFQIQEICHTYPYTTLLNQPYPIMW